MIKTMKKINVQKVMNDWDKLSTKHAKFGASDTEPDWQFQNSIRCALNGKNSVPQSPNAWEIFTFDGYKNGSEKAAKELTKFTQKVVDQILATPTGEIADLKREFQEHLWRVDVNEFSQRM